MKTQVSVISSGYNLVWFVYTVHYLILFAILGNEVFDVAMSRYGGYTLLPLNIVMNSISIILAIIGVIIANQAARKDPRYWTFLNKAIHVLMILWIFGGSLWVLLLLA